jgi:hypothetical protein
MVHLRTENAAGFERVEESYDSMKERLRRLTIRRAERHLAEQLLAPSAEDVEDENLWREIREAKQRFEELERSMNSGGAAPIFSECYEGDHRLCRDEIRIQSHPLRCNCSCHLSY